MLHTGDHRRRLRGQRGEHERGPRAQVGDLDLATMERGGAGDARVALVSDLDDRAHLHQLGDVVQAVLVDRLVDGGDALRLGHQHGERRLEIGREAGVRLGLDLRSAVRGGGADVDLFGADGGVAIGPIGDSHPVEDVEEGAQVGRVDPGDRHVAARHRGGNGEGTRFQPVADHPMLHPVQQIHALDLQHVGRGPLDPRAHGAQHGDEVVRLRLLGGVLDDRLAIGQDRGEQRVLGAHDRHVRELDPRAVQAALGCGGEVVAVLVLDLRAHGGHGLHVEVHRPPPDAVAAGVRDDHPPEAGQQRAEEDERCAHLHGRLERDEEPLRVAGAELKGVGVRVADVESDVAHGLAQDRHVADLGDVAQDAGLRGERRSGHQLEDRVLGPRNPDLASQRLAAGDHELLHRRQSSRLGDRSRRPGFLPLVRPGVVPVAQPDPSAHVARRQVGLHPLLEPGRLPVAEHVAPLPGPGVEVVRRAEGVALREVHRLARGRVRCKADGA